MSFTEQEKGRVLHHLGYPSFSSLSNGIQLGFPAGAQPLFLVEQSFVRLSDAGEESVRADLCQCEDIEAQLADARSRMKARKLGELEMNAAESTQLRGELEWWRDRLADDLGCARNPYSNAYGFGGGGGGINARVLS